MKLELHSQNYKNYQEIVRKQEFEIDVGKLEDHDGVFRDFGLSRHVVREMAHQCLLPGVRKSSW